MKENIFVIVVNYKSYKDTITYVTSLLRQENITLNITIVDNDSQNGSFDFLENYFKNSLNVKVYNSGENIGYAKGNNYGISQTDIGDNDLIVISNNDLIITETDFLFRWALLHRKLLNVGLSAPAMRVNGKLSPYMAWKIPTYFDSLKASVATLETLFGDNKVYLFDDCIDILNVDCVPGSLFMVEKKVLSSVNFFDENTFLYMEEVILSRKLKDKEKCNYLIRELEYEHLVSKTISAELPSKRMRKCLKDSVVYYHKKYDRIGKFKIKLLEFLFYIWKLENMIVCVMKRKKGSS